MGDAPAWAAIGISVLTFMWTEYRFGRERRRRRAAGPTRDIRVALTDLRAPLEDVVAVGRDSAWFMHEARRDLGRRVRDQIRRTSDLELAAALEAAADAWDAAFALAPRRRGARMIGRSIESDARHAREDAERIAAFAKAAKAAGAGLDEVRGALRRLAELERQAA